MQCFAPGASAWPSEPSYESAPLDWHALVFRSSFHPKKAIVSLAVGLPASARKVGPDEIRVSSNQLVVDSPMFITIATQSSQSSTASSSESPPSVLQAKDLSGICGHSAGKQPSGGCDWATAAAEAGAASPVAGPALGWPTRDRWD